MNIFDRGGKPLARLTAFINAAMDEAKYKIFEDGTFFGEIENCPGVWSNELTLETCRAILQEILEEWLLMKIRDGDPLPVVKGIDLNVINELVKES